MICRVCLRDWSSHGLGGNCLAPPAARVAAEQARVAAAQLTTLRRAGVRVVVIADK